MGGMGGVQLATEALSGVVNGLLMFVFCYVFASLIFGPEEVGLGGFVPLGAGTNTITAFVLGLGFAFYSDCGVSIAGPDINPTIFFAQMAVKIREYVDTHALDATPYERDQRTLTTILFSIIFGSAISGLWFFSLGRFRLTRIVQFVPAAVLSGFLASVGVIIMVKAVKACTGDELAHHLGMYQFWALLAPAVPIGTMLYCAKRFHIGSPIWMIPLCLFGPFILFYVAVYGTGNDIDSIRAQNLCDDHNFTCGWLYEEYEAVLVTDQWTRSYGQANLIEWAALAAVVPDLLVMLIIISLDSLLKISGTKKQLKITELDYDHEMLLGGRANMLLVFLVGAPGYAQLKFNALNSGIIHNTDSRLPGIIAALFNGGLFFAGFPLINFLPRFFIGALLIYAGMGFVVENLIDTWIQNRLSMFEYVTVVAIVVLSQAFSMLIAVVVGVMLSFVLFVIQYSKTGVIKAVLSGKDFQSSVMRSTQEDAKLEHLSTQVVIIKLKRYIFFGSANQITDLVRDILEDGADDPDDYQRYRSYSINSQDSEEADSLYANDTYDVAARINTIVFDFEDVYGIDFTACGTIGELVTQLVESNQAALAAEREQRAELERIREQRASGEACGPEHIDPDSTAIDIGRTNSPTHSRRSSGSDFWESNIFLRTLRNKFGRKKRTPPRIKNYTIVFTGMSDKVYRRLKGEGIIDLIHFSGLSSTDKDMVREVMPSISAVPRTRRLANYITAVMSSRRKSKQRRQTRRSAAGNLESIMDKQKANNSSGDDLRPGTKHDSSNPLSSSRRSANDRDFVDDAKGHPRDNVSTRHNIGASQFEDDIEEDEVELLEVGPAGLFTDESYAPPRPATTSDYYKTLDFPTEYRRVFPTLDLAMEWVEERLLERACTVRQRWLVFHESFQVLHEQARLKAQHEPFEHILGGHLGDSVWKYIQPIRVPEGSHLCTAGEINPHLFLLQHGRLTSYMVRNDESLIRIQSHHRGAFINEDAIFVEYPLSHTVIADEDSIVLALSRENLKLLELESPEVAFEIHRNVLRHTARVRNRLARELDVVDHWSLHERLARSSNDQAVRRLDTFAEHKSFYLGTRTQSFYHHGRTSSHIHSSPSGIHSVVSRGSAYSSASRHGSLGRRSPMPQEASLSELELGTPASMWTDSSARFTKSTHPSLVSTETNESDDLPASAAAGGFQSNNNPNTLALDDFNKDLQQQQQQQQQQTNNLLTPKNGPESHLQSTSKSVGRVIMKEARKELKSEQQRATENSSGDSQEPMGPKPESSSLPPPSSPISSSAHALGSPQRRSPKQTAHSRTSPKSSPTLSASAASALVAPPPLQLTAYSEDQTNNSHDMTVSSTGSRSSKLGRSLRKLPEIFKANAHTLPSQPRSERPRLKGAFSSHHDDGEETSDIVRYLTQRVRLPSHHGDTVRSTRSSIGPDRSPSLRNPSMCFRPDLQRNKFLHAPSRTDVSDDSHGVNIVDADLVRQHLHLSQLQKVDAVACLKRAVSNRFHARGRKLHDPLNNGGSDVPISPPPLEHQGSMLQALFSTGLPQNRLQQTLMDMGHFPSETELQDIVSTHGGSDGSDISEEQFLGIVRDLSLEDLADDHIQGFALFFNRHAQDVSTLLGAEPGEERSLPDIPVLGDKLLTVEGLHELLDDLGHTEDPHRLEKMFQEWSDFSVPQPDGKKPVRVLQFVSLCSMMAHHIMAEKLDEQVAEDFKDLTRERCLDDIIMVSDILHAMRERNSPCTRQEAEEMVFEADVTGNGGVSYDDLVNTLTTVFNSEIVPQLEQLTNDLIDNTNISHMSEMASSPMSLPRRPMDTHLQSLTVDRV